MGSSAESRIAAQRPLREVFGFDGDETRWLEHLRRVDAPLAGAGASASAARIGEYELLGEVGRGGQGVVFRARQPRTGREIALKRLSAGAFATPDMRARFAREVAAAAALDHPNIVAVYGSEIIDGQPVLVMEWVDGLPFDRWAAGAVDGGPRRPVREVLQAFDRVCDGMIHAHQRGVIHRDLKPSNILVDRHGSPQLLDFGLAKLLFDSGVAGTLTETGMFCGTPLYAAPEQARGDAAAVDVRSDVYALGAVLYEALTGRTPFAWTGNLAELLRDVETAEPTRPSLLRADAGREVEAITLKALAKRPEERYSSVEALRADVRRWLGGEAVLAHPPTAVYRLRKFVARHRAGVTLASAFSLLLASASVVSTTLYFRAERLRTAAEASAEKARAATRYLQDIFRHTNPHEGYEVGYTVRQLVDDIAPRIGAELRGQPEIEATLHSTLANAYRELGDLPAAEREADAALRLSRPLSATDPELEIHARIGAAWVLHDQARWADAESQLREAISLIGARPDASGLRAKAQMIQADLLRHRGRYDDAFELARGSLATRARLFGEDHDETIKGLNALAEVERERQNFSAAEALLRRALAARTRTLGSDHPAQLTAQLNLAQTLVEMNRLPEAEAIYHEALAFGRAKFGAQHRLVARTLSGMGEVFLQRGEPARAEPLLREALAIGRGVWREDHPDYLELLRRFGRATQSTHDLAETEAMLRNVLGSMPRIVGGDDYRRGTVLNDLCVILIAQGRYREAEPLGREAVAIYRGHFTRPHRYLATVIGNLGDVLSNLGRCDEALQAYSEALDIRVETLGEHHPESAWTRFNMAWCRLSAGDAGEAESLYRSALTDLRDALGTGHVWTVKCAILLGELVLGRGEDAEAETLFVDAYQAGVEALGPDHKDVLRATVDLGWLHRVRGQFREAEPYYRRALEGRRATAGERHADTQRVRIQYAQVLFDLGDFDQAERQSCELVRIQRETAPANSAFMAAGLLCLGESRLRLEQFEPAETSLLEAVEIAAPSPSTKRFADAAMRALVRLYDAMQQPETAAAWRARLNPAADHSAH